MTRVLILHHPQLPLPRLQALGACFPGAPYQAPGAVVSRTCFGCEVPVVGVLAAAVAANVGDAAFVVVGRRDAGVAVGAGVQFGRLSLGL